MTWKLVKQALSCASFTSHETIVVSYQKGWLLIYNRYHEVEKKVGGAKTAYIFIYKFSLLSFDSIL